MAISDTVKAEITECLLRDIEATLGSRRHLVVQASIENASTFLTEPSQFIQWVVDDVQQLFHDTFVDTSWPRCPRHEQHPLWLQVHSHGAVWYCHQDHAPIARLGELDRLRGSETTG